MRIQDLPKGIVYLEGFNYSLKGYLEENFSRIDVYTERGRVVRVPYTSVEYIEYETYWKNPLKGEIDE